MAAIKPPGLYLASRSPRRRRILKKLKLRFTALKPSYREKNVRFLAPSVLAKRHALGKARSCVGRVAEGIVLGADTLLFFRGKMIGKPKNRAAAAGMLKRLRGRWHTVYTGVALLEVRRGRARRRRVFFDKTKVRLKPLTRAEISAYLKRVNPLDKAGAYAIQSKRFSPVAEWRGSFSNVAGLPEERLLGELRKFGFKAPV